MRMLEKHIWVCSFSGNREQNFKILGEEDHLLEPGEKEVRNPQIVEAFRRLGLCEQAGTGMRMVLNQWQALGHLEPEYDNDRSRKTFEIRLPLAKKQVTEQVTGEVSGSAPGFPASAMVLFCFCSI